MPHRTTGSMPARRTPTIFGRLALFGVVAALVAMPVCASAQDDDSTTGSRLKSPPPDLAIVPGTTRTDDRTQSDTRARRAALKTASCVLLSRRDDAKALLLDPAFDPHWGDLVSRCYTTYSFDLDSSMINMPANLWRGALAEAYIRKAGNPLPPALTTARKSYRGAWITSSDDNGVVEQMAACFAEMHPELVGALIATDPGSSGEAQALGAVAPRLGPCLVKNATLKTNASGLRAALAEALFHREFDPVSAVASANGN